MSDGFGNIQYNTPSRSGAQPPFVNIGGARNGTSLDAGSFVTLGQDVGAAGDPAALLSNRQIPMPGGTALRLTGFDADPVRETNITPSVITLTADDAIVEASFEILGTTSGGDLQLTSTQVSVFGNAAGGAPAQIALSDQDIVLFPWNVTADDATLSWIMQWGDTSSVFSNIRFLDGGTMQIARNGVASPSNTTALLELISTVSGFLPTRMTSIQKNAIVAPAEGLVVYDTTLHKLALRTAAVWETVTSI